MQCPSYAERIQIANLCPHLAHTVGGGEGWLFRRSRLCQGCTQGAKQGAGTEQLTDLALISYSARLQVALKVCPKGTSHRDWGDLDSRSTHYVTRDTVISSLIYEDDFTSGRTVHERDLVLFTFLTVLSLFDQVCKIVKERDHMSLMLIAVRPEVKASSYPTKKRTGQNSLQETCSHHINLS